MSDDRALSERERQILRLVATGASNKEIAHQLVISTNTVKVHLRNIFGKTGVMSRTEATLYAIREGLVQVGDVRAADSGTPEPATDAETLTPEETTALPSSWWRRLAGWRLVAVASAVALVLVAATWAGAVTLGPLMAPPTRTTTPTPSLVLAISPAPATASRWRVRAPMPTARAGLGVAAYDARIYAIAGDTDQGPTGANERYDPTSDTWTILAPKPVPVADVGAAVVGGRIYVPGGRLASGSVTSTLEVYDPARDAWEVRAPLPIALSGYALVAFEGRLYVFGGWDGASYLASVYEYDPGRDTWTARTPMPTARAYAGAAVAGGKVYVVGGYDGREALATNEEYTPSKDGDGQGPWRSGASLPYGLFGMGIGSVADMIHLVGGQGQDSASPAALKYLPQQDTWQPLEALGDPPWSHLGAAPVESYLYGVGGRLSGVPSGQNRSYQAVFVVLIPTTR